MQSAATYAPASGAAHTTPRATTGRAPRATGPGFVEIWRSAIALSTTLERTPADRQGDVIRAWAKRVGITG